MENFMSKALESRTAFVTGGSRGIGAAIVRRLAAEGAAITFTYAGNQAKAGELVHEIEAGGGHASAIQADSADPDALRRAIDAAARTCGGLDILVNNAGQLKQGSVFDYEIAAFDQMFNVNVRAAFFATQAAVAHMKEGGRIILIGSVTAERTGFANSSVYSMTKGALASMTRGLARDLGPRGITVVNVQPGPTITDMSHGEDPAVEAMLTPLMALGRLGDPAEIASFVAYLAGPEAGFITGASLTIDGGYLT
jgi:3-oxoacyl-[acyl-carrier protein] reductase